MRRSWIDRLGWRLPAVLFAALALLPLVAMLGPRAYILALAARMMAFAIAALSLDLILGFGAMVSFGHAAFIGIGAYATGILMAEGVGEALIALPVAIAASALFAFVTGAISTRTRSVAFIMITLAFGQMAYFVANALSNYGGSDGMSLGDRSTLGGTELLHSDIGFFYAVFLVLLVVFVALKAVTVSPFGRALAGAGENSERMNSLGYSVRGLQLTACVIAGAIAGIAGFLLANEAQYVSPALMSWQRSGDLIIMVVLGGAGTLVGPMAAAIGYLWLEEWLSGLMEHWRLVFGPMLVAVVLLKHRPSGKHP